MVGGLGLTLPRMVDDGRPAMVAQHDLTYVCLDHHYVYISNPVPGIEVRGGERGTGDRLPFSLKIYCENKAGRRLQVNQEI